MSNIVMFPRNPGRSLGVRFIPSSRAPGLYEVQQFQDGSWRVKSVHHTRDKADLAAKKLVEKVILERMAAGGAA